MKNLSSALSVLAKAGMIEYLQQHSRRFPTVLVASEEHIDVFRAAFPTVDIQSSARYEPNALEHLRVLDGHIQGEHITCQGAVPFFSEGVAALICKAGDIHYCSSHSKDYYVISTPRSGSTFLADLLTSTGKLGYPDEHLKPWLYEYLALSGVSANALLRGLRRYSASSNGVFGSKIIIDDLFNFFPDYLTDFMDALRKGTVFLLIRGNKAAQAISNIRASQQSIYHANDATTVENIVLAPSIDFDMMEVFQMERWLLRQEADLIDLLIQNDVAVHVLSYESIVQNRSIARVQLLSMAQKIGVDDIDDLTWPSLVRIAPLTGPTAQLQYDHFRSDIVLFSARSEPNISSILLDGWGNVEHWGVSAISQSASLRIPSHRRWRYFEALINLSSNSPDSVKIDEYFISLIQHKRQFRQVRLLVLMKQSSLTELTISYQSGLLSLEEIVYYVQLPVSMSSVLSQQRVFIQGY